MRVEAVVLLIYALKELLSVVIYVPAMYFGILPNFYLNIGYDVFWGFMNLLTGLFMYAISRPVAAFISERLEDKEVS